MAPVLGDEKLLLLQLTRPPHATARLPRCCAQAHLYDYDSPGWAVLAGHFTQLVWRGTTKLGCAINKACTWTTYVCQYWPAGNDVTADWSTNVMPALPVGAQDQRQAWQPATILPGQAYYASEQTSAAGGSSQSAIPAPLQEPSSADKVAQAPAPPPTWQPPQELDLASKVPLRNEPVGQQPVEPADPAPQQPVPANTAVPSQDTTQQQLLQPAALSQSNADSHGMPETPVTAESPPTLATAPAPANNTASSSTSSTRVPGLDADLQAGFDATNSYRRLHAVPILTWDASTAASAAKWAAGCPNGHSGAPALGENMACEWGVWRRATEAEVLLDAAATR